MHFQRIDADLREHIYLENGYGESFGVTDGQLAPYVGGLLPRDGLLGDCDVIVLPKLQPSDLAEMREGQIVWGWPHCVQDAEVTQRASELAGYCSVLHALELIGTTGIYGRRLRAAVIGFGATARGAVTALNAHGVGDVRVLTNRMVAAVGSPIHSVQIVHLDHDSDDPNLTYAVTNDGRVALAPFLAENDIVVNCVLQDTDAPLTFLTEQDLGAFLPGSLIVDVSCDEGMGFSWARPTSFTAPSFVVGDNVHYYAVDHSPSYLWNSATWEISEALLPHLRTVLAGRAAWEADPTIGRAIEIRDGEILNPNVLSFQHRSDVYPHAVVSSGILH
jgi:alanine dehydrogenase